MKVAVTSDKNNMKGKVPKRYNEANYLLIIETDTGEIIQTYERNHFANADILFGQKTVEWDCEAIICGEIEREPFAVLAEEGSVTRYNGTGCTIEEALKRMETYQLQCITDHIGGTGCPSHHHEKTECSCND
jgi:predicted Fe-Mo cluster-binding NifX family protein